MKPSPIPPAPANNSTTFNIVDPSASKPLPNPQLDEREARVCRRQGIPLFSWESRRPVREFDILGITIPYELSYTGIVEILDRHGLSIALAAPTGRAAKRMEEATGRPAKPLSASTRSSTRKTPT